MTSTSLIEQISSDYFGSLSALSGVRRVVVYVEGWDDVAFWSNILCDFPGVQYDIMPPVRDNLSKGKKVVLSFVDSSGPNLFLAVDSDFDWLFEDNSLTWTQMKRCNWLLQTYAYSIENLQCTPSSLQSVFVRSNKVTTCFDFCQFFSDYSVVIYPLFLWYVWAAFSKNSSLFPLKRFSNAVALYGLTSSQKLDKSIARLSKTVSKVLKDLSRENPGSVDEVREFSVYLRGKGVVENQTIFYMQGHALKDKVVIPLLQMLSSEAVDAKVRSIEMSEASECIKQNQIDYYKNSIVPLKFSLNDNTGYKSSCFFEKIRKDIDKLLN